MSKRSLKISGVTTSLFLEEAFWSEIQIRAEDKGITNAEFIRNILAKTESVDNRSAAVKEQLMHLLREEYQVLERKQSGMNGSKPSSVWLLEYAGKRRRMECGGPAITIGRSARCDITLDDSEIATKQALLTYDGSAWWVVNLAKSLNITVNSKIVDVGRVAKNIEVGIGPYNIIKG